MTYHRVCNKSNTTGVTCGAGTGYPSGIPDSIPGFIRVLVSRSLVFCVVFCRSLFAFCPFSLDHCIVCPPCYDFYTPLWYMYLQSFIPLTFKLNCIIYSESIPLNHINFQVKGNVLLFYHIFLFSIH
jgi:hypothetical protein